MCAGLIFCLFTSLVSFIHIFEKRGGMNASCSISLCGPFSRSVSTHCFMMKSLLVPAWSTMTLWLLLTVWLDPSLKARETPHLLCQSTSLLLAYWTSGWTPDSQLGRGGDLPELCTEWEILGNNLSWTYLC